MEARVIPVPVGEPAFLGGERCDDLEALAADIAIIGVPFGVPYDMAGSTSPSSASPQAIRAQSLGLGRFLTHYDFDFGGDLLAGRAVRIVDCGDVAMQPGQYEANSAATTAVIRRILERGAVPVVLGGDHSIPIPVMRAYEGTGDLCVVQIDAHLDWRDEINGVHQGLSSPMRRASELPFVRGMAQLGIRGVGSGRQREIDDARAFGSVIIGAAELHRDGVAAAMAKIPAADRYYLTLDLDGLDPSIAPGVNALSHGGLSYFQAFDLLRGVAAKGSIVGFDVVEMAPALDVRNLTSLLAVRLIMNVIGSMAHSGQIGVE
ncbi:MAG: agmatinase [Thermomicrobiales bacterium]